MNWEKRKIFGLLLQKFKKDTHIEESSFIPRGGSTVLAQNVLLFL